MDINQTYRPGEVVYIIIRNPHAQDVAQVQQAAVVENPDAPNELALFLHETYFPLSDEFAIYRLENDAEQAYQDAFGNPEIGGEFYG
ncbi:transcriptional regulator SplA domain-containing protein [Oceanobacillus chungangensis]|uniref:Transcriptional regulator n=1 Tax=Oceanobacillus chungangensis TaxID=1229152 RepID=A0A3D8PWN7_9BACI|nr:transcriptional regulator SplA domain-containing protein [Oceanobacillus chungangensis]RDW19688.1 transcriptional regulator [Oceanobacillus chungangensis]